MGRLSSAPAVDHRSLAIALYNDCWRLLEKDRSAAEDDELLHQAHASAYHWLKAPEREAKNRARSEWLWISSSATSRHAKHAGRGAQTRRAPWPCPDRWGQTL